MSKKKIENSQVLLNVTEMKEFISHMVENNQYIQTQGKVPVAINIEGDAGLGKTSAIMQLGKEMNMQVVKLNLSQLEELGDLVGFPVKEFEIQNQEGKKMWINEAQIDAAVKKGYQVVGKRMSHAAPEWIQGKGEGGFLILDDYTRADHRFMQATMEILDRQEYVSWKLPKNWHVILTTNPDNGDYNVTSLDVAQKTRFISVGLKYDKDVWAKWAETSNIDGRCINFMLMHPELVTQSVNPRAVTTFFNAISSFKNFNQKLPMIQMIGEGSVGVDFAAMFTMFINNQLDKIISPEDILTKDEQYVMNSLTSAVGKDQDFRADISSVIATRLVNYSLVHAETKSVTDLMANRLIKLTTDCEAFTDDLRYYMIKEIVNGNKLKFSKLMMNNEVVKMAVK
jgi:nucleoside-triphosphatase THEP1